MIQKRLRVLVLGANGMAGNAVFRFFSNSLGFETFGTVRSSVGLESFSQVDRERLFRNIDVENTDSLVGVFALSKPDIVINCIGVIKQLSEATNPLLAIPLNALFPHRVAELCKLVGARMIHLSTDCVFSGKKGMYTEADIPDAKDLYGLSKYLGEVDYSHAITLRTSIIGHELNGSRSLVGWFLSQTNTVKGFRLALFSGLPTVEIARIIRDYVIPHFELHGLYHVSSEPINKYDLLKLLSQAYHKIIDIQSDDQLVIDRSLDSTRFREATGYVAPKWPELIRLMSSFK